LTYDDRDKQYWPVDQLYAFIAILICVGCGQFFSSV
jgi:hypothetical protein